MSVKRYTLEMVSSEAGHIHWMHDNEEGLSAPLGEYVRYEDYDATCETLAHTETERDAEEEENARLKAEVEWLSKADRWRPIETAPKDEEILVWNKEMKRRAWTVIWSDEYGAFVSSQTHFLFKGDFTHWMPLPKPPSV